MSKAVSAAGAGVRWVTRGILTLVVVLGGLWLLASYTAPTVLVLLLWVLPVLVGMRLARAKERDAPIPLAIFLGWLGVLLALALSPGGRRCPRCDETIRRNATVCRFCGSESEPFSAV